VFGAVEPSRDLIRWFDLEMEDLAARWRERWAVPRGERDLRYLAHERGAMRITPKVEQLERNPPSGRVHASQTYERNLCPTGAA